MLVDPSTLLVRNTAAHIHIYLIIVHDFAFLSATETMFASLTKRFVAVTPICALHINRFIYNFPVILHLPFVHCDLLIRGCGDDPQALNPSVHIGIPTRSSVLLSTSIHELLQFCMAHAVKRVLLGGQLLSCVALAASYPMLNHLVDVVSMGRYGQQLHGTPSVRTVPKSIH